MAHPRAGQPAQPEDLVDVSALESAYYGTDTRPRRPRPAGGVRHVRTPRVEPRRRVQRAAHPGDHAGDLRVPGRQGVTGPLVIGRDPHALSLPAWHTALEVLVANDVTVLTDEQDGFTPTPAVSHAILRLNREGGHGQVDGIVVTPSHNPPRDGGFKYNPPHGGPADSDATGWIAARANELLRADLAGVRRVNADRTRDAVQGYDFLGHYVDDLPSVLDLDAVRSAGVRIGADPLGGASVDYWGAIAERHRLDLTVVNPEVDPQWAFMTLDTDGKIRMDCSSPNAMASLIANRDAYAVSTGNDADADRHGIVTPDAGLMNPNHFLAVAIGYLFAHRPDWGPDVAVGKTLVSSSMIDRVVADLGRRLLEVPVGFKWFVPGLLDGSVGFGGEESAGASFLRRDGSVWTTDKDGLLLALLAAEIQAVTGRSPSELYADLAGRFGETAYARVDAPADRDAEGAAGEAVARAGHGDGAGRRADHRAAHPGAGQRRSHRWA